MWVLWEGTNLSFKANQRKKNDEVQLKILRDTQAQFRPTQKLFFGNFRTCYPEHGVVFSNQH